MRSLSYIFYNSFFKHILKLYLKTDSRTKFDGFRLKIFKEVFHPKLFFSTSYFYNFLSDKHFKDKNFLEIGSGSGILSMLARRKGARVTAVDIDPKAVENTRLNFSKNFGSLNTVHILQSDLFSAIPPQVFDVIVINPPYYFKKVEAQGHYAWYCGENGEYFTHLFSELKNYTAAHSRVYMVLEENCDIERIRKIASAHGVALEKIHEKLIKWEKSYIFSLSAFPSA